MKPAFTTTPRPPRCHLALHYYFVLTGDLDDQVIDDAIGIDDPERLRTAMRATYRSWFEWQCPSAEVPDDVDQAIDDGVRRAFDAGNVVRFAAGSDMEACRVFSVMRGEGIDGDESAYLYRLCIPWKGRGPDPLAGRIDRHHAALRIQFARRDLP